MKLSALLFLAVATLSTASFAQTQPSPFTRCEQWITSQSAKDLAFGNFSLALKNKNGATKFGKDWPIMCNLVLPTQAHPDTSRVCVQGDLAQALPYLKTLAANDIGLHGKIIVKEFKLKAVNQNSLVFSLTTLHKSEGVEEENIANIVNCGDDGGPACNLHSHPPVNPNCGEAGNAGCDKGPAVARWEAPATQDFSFASCGE